jgi:hypothetical protein
MAVREKVLMAFNPNDHLISLKGKSYLEVKWRMVWFRQEHPDYGMSSQIIEHNIEKKYAIVKATITDNTGRVLAEGTKMEDIKGFGDYLEKAETGAYGRALGALGYGTQFAPEFDEVVDGVENPRIVDAPVTLKATPPRPQVMDLKTAGIEFSEVVNSFEGKADGTRLKFVFSLLTAGAERTTETLRAAAEAIRPLTPEQYYELLVQLEPQD